MSAEMNSVIPVVRGPGRLAAPGSRPSRRDQRSAPGRIAAVPAAG